MTTTQPTISQFEADSRRFYRRNFIAGLVHGVFFQASAAFGSIHTVLPSFVALLTSSTIAVGLMASIEGVGEVLPQMFTAYLIEDRPRKKPFLLAIITVRWVSWAILAYLTFSFGVTQPNLVLAVLIGLFGLFRWPVAWGRSSTLTSSQRPSRLAGEGASPGSANSLATCSP